MEMQSSPSVMTAAPAPRQLSAHASAPHSALLQTRLLPCTRRPMGMSASKAQLAWKAFLVSSMQQGKA